MEKICDLHCHSVYSDGSLTPAQLVEEAVRQGVSALALSDHDTTRGLAEFTAAAEGKLEAVRSVEVSTDYRGNTLHIHALFLPPEQDAALQAYIDENGALDNIETQERSRIDYIKGLGYAVDYDTLMESAKGAVCVPLCYALAEKGYAEDAASACFLMKKLFNAARPHLPQPRWPDTIDTIRFIRSLGAVPVWAHPFVTLSEEEIPGFLEQAVPAGLQGMEVFYYSYDEETTQKSLVLADRFGLRYSGGSDFHGLLRPAVQVGRGKGNLSVPYSLCTALKTT